MYESHIVWGDGTGYYKNYKITQYSKKGVETVPELTQSKTIKIFFANDALLFLSKNGEVYQKGNFSFQQEKVDNKLVEVKKIEFGYDKKIKQIKMGENHILFLDSEGVVYSMGDNYYGQLGIGKKMISVKTTPCVVSIPTKHPIEEIHVYKNTSFAIDKARHLFLWGKSEFIPKYQGNLYLPKIIFQNLKIIYLRHDSNRIIIKTAPHDENEFEQKRQMAKQIEETKGGTKEGKEEGKEKGLFKTKFFDIFKSGMKGKIIDAALEKNNSLTFESELLKLKQTEKQKQQYIAKNFELFSIVNETIKELLSLMDEKNDTPLNQLNEMIEKQHEFIVTDWEHPEIQKILEYIDKLAKTELKEFSPKQKEDVDNSLFLSFMSLKYKSLGDNKAEAVLRKLNEEINKIVTIENPLTNIDSVITKELKILSKNAGAFNESHTQKINSCLIKEIYFFLNYFFKYKKLEFLIYKMAMHNFIINTYEIYNAKSALEEIFSKSINSIEKNKIIIKKFEMIQRNIIKFIDVNLKEIDLFYQNLPKRPNNINRICKDNDESEQYLYKRIIESAITIKDLWTLTIKKFKQENKKREELQIISQKLELFKEIYGIQIYLEKIIFDFVLAQEKNDKSVYITKQMKIQDQCNQIDGAINRLMKIKDTIFGEEKPDPKNIVDNETEEEGGIAKEMLLMYITSVIEIAYTKKAIWALLQSNFYP